MLKSKLTKPNGKIIVVTHDSSAPLDPENGKIETVALRSSDGTCFRIEKSLVPRLEMADIETIAEADEEVREAYATKTATHAIINRSGGMRILGLIDKYQLGQVLFPHISVEDMERKITP